MKKLAAFLSVVAALGAFAAACAADFAEPSAWRLSRHASVTNGILVVDVPAVSAAEGGSGRARVDLAPFAGKLLEAEIRVRGENVTKGSVGWLGMKFMLHYGRDDGAQTWPQAKAEHGTFGWKTARITHDMTATSAKGGTGELVLGLQSASGRLEFDLSSLKLREAAPIWPRVNGELKAKYSERVSSLPRLRGVMLPGGDVKRDDFETLSKWGATLARYQMIRGWGKENDNQDVGEYVKWLDGRLDHLERVVLPLAREFGIRIVVDLHVPPGGRDSDGEMNMFHDAAFADCFVSCWSRIAKRFAGNSDIIYGYDLINEPQQMRRALENCDYWNLQRRAAEAARAADPETTIIIESNGWDAPSAFAYLSPLAMDNVIYQAHMYIPHEFTHQGVGGRKWDRCAYPDEKRGWNRAWLRRQIEPVVAFGKRHGARIYFGEFSAIAWADGADRYIADVASIFEECGFDWTYHAFREWQGWSVEHECDRPGGKFRGSDDNPRMRALRSALKAGR